MRTTLRSIIAVGIIYFSLTLSTYIKPEWLCTMLSLLTLTMLVVSLLVTTIIGISKWRHQSRFWIVPALACVAFIASTWMAPPIGRFVADWEFGRHLNEYSRVVNDVRNGVLSCATPCQGRFSLVEMRNRPKHIKALKAAQCSNEAVAVAFVIDTDVPLLHEGYVFRDFDESVACATDAVKLENNWPYIRHVSGQWYHFSDQPGL